MMTVSYSVNEQIIFVMSKRFSINLQSLAFKLILGSVNMRCQEEVDVLSYIVSKNGIKPQNVTTLEIQNFRHLEIFPS